MRSSPLATATCQALLASRSLPGAPQALISLSAHAPRWHLCSRSIRVDGTICDDALQKIVRVASDDVGQARALSRMHRQHEPPIAAALLARAKASIGHRRSCRGSFRALQFALAISNRLGKRFPPGTRCGSLGALPTSARIRPPLEASPAYQCLATRSRAPYVRPSIVRAQDKRDSGR